MKYRWKIGAIAAAWKGLYSRFSFDETDNYIGILKEKNVPVVDDEFNFIQESFFYRLRLAIGSLFKSNGALGEGTGWQVTEAAAPENDFNLAAGRVLVDGHVIDLPTTLDYSTQDGHTDTAATLTTPTGDRDDEVYLEFWFEEHTESDDADIPDPTLAQRTSSRLKLLWKVIVAEGSTTPASGTTGDIYYWRQALCTLERLDANADITTAMITYDKLAPLDIVTESGTQTLLAKTLTTPRVNTPKINEDVTTNITSTQLNTLKGGDDASLLHTHDAISSIPAGTRMLFHQTAAPTGWTKDESASIDDRALRVVKGTIGSSGTRSLHDAKVGGHALSANEMPEHTHQCAVNNTVGGGDDFTDSSQPFTVIDDFGGYQYTLKYGHAGELPDAARSSSVGGDGSHDHDLDIRYMDVIVAVKS